MHCLTVEQERMRGRFFQRKCPLRKLDQQVFHGSPLLGMVEILRDGKLTPRGHAELPSDEWLSVSVNDNVLQLFNDGESGATGFGSSPKLSVRHLDPFHLSAATGRTCRVMDCEVEKSWASRLGYVNSRSDADMEDRELRLLLDKGHGLVFPDTRWCNQVGFHFHNWNDEAEIALNEEGCHLTWLAIDLIYVEGEEFDDVAEGWTRVVSAALKRKLVDRAEAKHLSALAEQ